MSGTSRRSSHRQVSVSSTSEIVAPTTSGKKSPPPSSTPTPAVKSGPASVAIDLGSYTIRICIVDQDGKSIVTRCPNALVRPSQKRYAGSTSNGLLAGPQIAQNCQNYGSLSIRQPMDRGFIVDWPTQKTILDAAIAEALGKEDSESLSNQRLLEGRDVIFTEAYLNLPDLQAGLDLLFLEAYGASRIWRCSPSYLIPYHSKLFTTTTGRKRSRPQCMCIIDLGHNATHVIPMIGDVVVWRSVRRHIITQRMLTNLLKETLSFRQWDMMDEPWLVGHIKEQCCFVASQAGRRGDVIDFKKEPPSIWTYAGMLEMCHNVPLSKNPLAVEYILPDYSLSSKKKLGYLKGCRDGQSRKDLDTFIANAGDVEINVVSTKRGKEEGVTEEEEEEESDDDFEEDSPRPSAPKRQPKNKANKVDKDEEMEQILVLDRERFQIPEAMFDPGIVGLDDAPLHRVVEASIKSCDEEIQGLLWANIVLVGGGAAIPGMKERIFNELRPLAPNNIPLQVWMSEEPTLTALYGAQSLLQDSSRLLRSHLLSATEYSLQASRERFGSWSGLPATSIA